MAIEHWVSAHLIGANASFQRAAREYAEEYAAMAVATERKIWDMYISKARDQSELVEGPNGPAVLMPYWVMRGPNFPNPG